MAAGNGDAPELTDFNQQIVENLTSGVIAVDHEGAIVTANSAARRILATAECVPGRPLGAVSGAEPLAELFGEAVSSGESLSRRELRLHLADGSARAIGLNVSLINGNGPPRGAIFLFADLTEWKRLERAAELNRQLASLGELTAGVVHELRNPVSVISGMAELLLRKTSEEDDKRGPLRTIMREATSLEHAIAQFLSFARPFDINPAPCDPHALAERACQLCERKAQEQNVSLALQSESRLPNGFWDAELIAKSVANIIGNAVDASPEGGTVSVSVFSEDEDVVFAVLDEGKGIHLQPGEDLFTPFFTQKEGGTGLGLSIAHRTITAHEGVVEYGNRSGPGAWFEVRLPLERSTAPDVG
jgi:PAS domain S-box-containing protein